MPETTKLLSDSTGLSELNHSVVELTKKHRDMITVLKKSMDQYGRISPTMKCF